MHKGVMSLRMMRMKGRGKNLIVGDGSEWILGSVHMKLHETLSTPVSNGANFWKRAGDISKTGK
jgi:hypothetical protein